MPLGREGWTDLSPDALDDAVSLEDAASELDQQAYRDWSQEYANL